MKRFYSFTLLLSIIFLLITVSCKKKGQSTDVSHSNKKEVTKSKFASNYPDFNPSVWTAMLKDKIEKDSILSPVYKHNEYIPVWLHDTLDTKNLYHFFDILSDVEMHGLSSELFSLTSLKSVTDSIDSGLYTSNIDTLHSKIYFVEQMATKAALKYITGMKFGFVNPRKLYGKNYDINITKPDSSFLRNLYKEIKEHPVNAVIDAQPTDNIYLRLQDEYKALLEKKDSISFPQIMSGNATYKLGDRSKHIGEIAKRLLITGEYSPDSTSNDSIHNELDENLLAAVNLFRKNNSYPEEKEVGKLTVDALNRPVSYYMEKIRANMERYRWRRTKSVHTKHIEVNVAAASLVASKPDSLPLTMRVCVGTVSNKTPLLGSDIAYLNLNPYWNVPKSIAQGEVAVLQKRDSTYIRRKNMKLYKGGKEVDVASIDWKKVNPSTFSYIVKQEPGYGNSLGLIKFMFNNNHSVYLHDTPSKMAFNRKNRAVSHGCVRVQKPFDLAFFCLSPVTDVYKDQLLYTSKMNPVSNAGKKLLRDNKLKKLPDIINLKADNKISLFIDYFTAFMYPNDDTLYYADDMYGYDTIILTALSPQQSNSIINDKQKTKK